MAKPPMHDFTANNLARLMAARGWSIDEVARHTGLDRRTIQGALHGTKRAHPRTVQRLADGLEVSPDEFFLDPARLLYRRFDQHTNPLVDDVVETHAELFADWNSEDFAELHSRVGSGGPLTAEGVLASVAGMNRKRDLFRKLALLLESNHATTIGCIIDALCAQVIVAD